MDKGSENEKEYGTCVYCQDQCNICSQACSRCLRKLTFYGGPLFLKNLENESIKNMNTNKNKNIDKNTNKK